MSSMNFVPHDTIIPSSWLNAINYFYYNVFNGCVDAASARAAIGALSSSDVSSTYETQAHAASTYAPLVAPALTGAATSATTRPLHDNTTAIANTAFVFNEVQDAVISGLPVTTYVFAYPTGATWNWPAIAGIIPFTGEAYDTLNEYNPTTSTFVPVNTGVYQFTLNASAISSGTSSIFALININSGAATHSLINDPVLTGASPKNYSASVVVRLTAADSVVVRCGYNSGSSVSGTGLSGVAYVSSLAIKRLV